MIFTILAILAITVMLWLFFLKRGKAKVSSQGIQTFDNVGNVTFSTENRLFRYIGYRDLPIGNFSISVNSNGQAVFIPIILTSNNEELSHRVAISVDIPYISNGRISGNTFMGTVKSPMDFRYKGNLRTKPLIRIFYGVY